jgi:hypothetical protein
MTTLVAIHEIHRLGADKKPEVIAPGKAFTATEDEVTLFVTQHNAARLPVEGEKITPPKAVEKQDSAPVDLSKLSKAELTKLATDLGLTVDPKLTNAQLVEAITAKKAEGEGDLI